MNKYKVYIRNKGKLDNIYVEANNEGEATVKALLRSPKYSITKVLLVKESAIKYGPFNKVSMS